MAFLQLFKPIRKDIGRDFSGGILSITEISLPEENEITNDNQRHLSPNVCRAQQLYLHFAMNVGKECKKGKKTLLTSLRVLDPASGLSQAP
jgi:hypothetical protein